MESNDRNKRDLPELVADILIALDAMNRRRQERMEQDLGGLRQEVGGLRQEMSSGFDRMEHAFNNMTTAVLDAMNRQTDRYQQTNTDVVDLARRVEALEKQVFNKAG